MKIFILRHEDRTQDCSFFSPLTLQGLDKAKQLVPILEKENIDVIFSSPFIRTLQTVYPYVKKTGIKINLEYSLCELHHENIIAKQSVGIYLPEYIAQVFNYEPSYKSLIEPLDIKYPESEKYIKERTKNFIKRLLMNYHETTHNILLVTHESLCLNIIESLSKVINIVDTKSYEKGKVSKVFDNYKWEFTQLN
jgi:broad specificity phosphatase PhoE